MTAYLDRVRQLSEGQPSLRVRARSRFEPVPPEAEPPWERSAEATPTPPGAGARAPGEHRLARTRPGAATPWAAGSRAAGPVRPRPLPAAEGTLLTADPAPGPPGPSAGRSSAGVPPSRDAAGQIRRAAPGDAAVAEGTGQLHPPGRRRHPADEPEDRPAAGRPAGAEPGTTAAGPVEAEPGTTAAPNGAAIGTVAASAGAGRARPGASPRQAGPEQQTGPERQAGPEQQAGSERQAGAGERSRDAYPALRSALAAADERDGRPSFAPAFPAWPPELSGDGPAPPVRAGHPGLTGILPADHEPDQVTVTIGRIDVRVGPPGPAAPDPRRTAQPGRRDTRRPGRLEDYLRARTAGRVG